MISDFDVCEDVKLALRQGLVVTDCVMWTCYSKQNFTRNKIQIKVTSVHKVKLIVNLILMLVDLYVDFNN